MHTHFNSSFYPIYTIQYDQIKGQQKQIDKYIPQKWQFILTNTGSFTQNLNSLFIDKITIEMRQKYQYSSQQKLLNIRNTWLIKNHTTLTTFAKSIWSINNKYMIYNKILNQQPIGYSLIDSEIDIHKHLQEIYCGYSNNLESSFQQRDIIWGRKYKVYYPNHSFVIMKEYFMPQILESLN